MQDIKDEFRTISGAAEGIYKEKGSKFLAFLYHVSDEEEVNQKLVELKSLHPKSRHICYSYKIGITGDRFRINDHGEPSGTAGRPIYNELLSADITDILLAVVRYFGGTKLGASGLINAYKTSSKEAILSSKIVTRYLYDYAKIHFGHIHTGKVYNSLKYFNIDILDQDMGMENWIKIGVRKSKFEEVTTQFLSHFHGISTDHVRHESFESMIKLEEL